MAAHGPWRVAADARELGDAAANGDETAVAAILAARPQALNEPAKEDGRPALWLAAAAGKLGTVRELLLAGSCASLYFVRS